MRRDEMQIRGFMTIKAERNDKKRQRKSMTRCDETNDQMISDSMRLAFETFAFPWFALHQHHLQSEDLSV